MFDITVKGCVLGVFLVIASILVSKLILAIFSPANGLISLTAFVVLAGGCAYGIGVLLGLLKRPFWQ